MNALAEYMQKIGLNDSSTPTELKIGQSFFNDGRPSQYHTIRYDFIPASVDATKTSALEFGEKGKVTVTMPNLEGTVADTTESVYQGSRKPHMKECLLIINNETGELILEKLNTSVMVKKTRVRQEDLTGKSLALNRKVEHDLQNGKSQSGMKFPSLVSSSAAPSSSSSSYSASSQPKLLPNKTSPPFGGSPMLHKVNQHSHAQTQQSRPGIVLPTLSRNSKTPSPPSMPTGFTGNGHSSNQKGSQSSTSGSAFGATAAAAAALGTNASKTGRLSEDSSSDSSDDENESSSSESSSSEDETVNVSKKPTNDITTSQSSQPSMPSMPSFLGKSMPSFLGKSKEVSPASTSNHSNRSVHSNNSPSVKQASAKNLSLSEDSDSDNGQANGNWNQKNKSSMSSLGASTLMPSMPSMPSSFGAFAAKPAPAPSMPSSLTAKVDSVLSNDLQLSESSSDEDE